MLKPITLIAALMFVLPSVTHAMAKKPPKNQRVGGKDRPAILVAATPRPESAECKAAKAYTGALRTEALNTLNRFAVQPSSAASQLEMSYYSCREKHAADAVSVAEISVCGGYLSQARLKDKLAENFKQCALDRAAEKRAIAEGLAPVKEDLPIILTTPDVQSVRAPASLSPAKASSAKSIR